MHSQTFRVGRLLLAASSLIALATPAHAETANAAGTGEVDQSEIVVTAQKRSERASDVPMSLTALAGHSVETMRLTQADDLSARVPNLQFSATVGENTPIFALRGVSMSDFSLNQAGPVAT